MHKRTIALIEALADGLTAYLTLQARYGLWPVYSEYLLYEPILRIGTHLRWQVTCEHKMQKKWKGPGDYKRIDFMFSSERDGLAVAMEVKWARDPKKSVAVGDDLKKLREVNSPGKTKMDARLMLVAGVHQLRDNDLPLLRAKLKGLSAEPLRVKALGAGKRAWGVSVFDVPAVKG